MRQTGRVITTQTGGLVSTELVETSRRPSTSARDVEGPAPEAGFPSSVGGWPPPPPEAGFPSSRVGGWSPPPPEAGFPSEGPVGGVVPRQAPLRLPAGGAIHLPIPAVYAREMGGAQALGRGVAIRLSVRVDGVLRRRVFAMRSYVCRTAVRWALQREDDRCALASLTRRKFVVSMATEASDAERTDGAGSASFDVELNLSTASRDREYASGRSLSCARRVLDAVEREEAPTSGLDTLAALAALAAPDGPHGPHGLDSLDALDAPATGDGPDALDAPATGDGPDAATARAALDALLALTALTALTGHRGGPTDRDALAALMCPPPSKGAIVRPR